MSIRPTDCKRIIVGFRFACRNDYIRGEDFIEINSNLSDLVASEQVMIRAYPNPFNNQSAIEYSLENAGNVILSVYDVQGRIVVNLADGWRPAGDYRVTFEGKDLPSGVYFVKLQTRMETRMQKMVMVK